MAQEQNSEELLLDYTNTMGTTLGPLYHALWNDVEWLNAKWPQYLCLFGTSEERVQILNESAPFFFHVAQSVLEDDVLLHIVRLTDPPSSCGETNLTLYCLPSAVEAALSADLTERLQNVADQRSWVKEWRDKRLAHKDLASVSDRGSAMLPRKSRETFDLAITAINETMRSVHAFYFKSDMQFDLFVASGDAEQLVFLLSEALQLQRDRTERIRSGKHLPSDLRICDDF